MAFENLDMVKVELDMYANDKLVQTTDEKKGKEHKLEAKEFGPQIMVVGTKALVEALDEDMLKAKEKESRKLSLPVEKAFGKRNKEMIKTFTKKAFDEQKIRPVPGMTYDFNGMYGTVKSVVGGRVMVDFNNPLAGKDIDIEYKIVEHVKDTKEIFTYVLETLLKMPQNMFEITAKEKEVTIKVPAQLVQMADQLKQTMKSYIKDFDSYTISFEELPSKK